MWDSQVLLAQPFQNFSHGMILGSWTISRADSSMCGRASLRNFMDQSWNCRVQYRLAGYDTRETSIPKGHSWGFQTVCSFSHSNIVSSVSRIQRWNKLLTFKRILLVGVLCSSYTRSKQIEAITKILGKNLNDNGEPIIEEGFSTSLYFARGHLSPDADFIYDVQQDATYYFINAAPQFQAFNNGNWKACEGAVRSYAER